MYWILLTVTLSSGICIHPILYSLTQPVNPHYPSDIDLLHPNRNITIINQLRVSASSLRLPCHSSTTRQLCSRFECHSSASMSIYHSIHLFNQIPSYPGYVPPPPPQQQLYVDNQPILPESTAEFPQLIDTESEKGTVKVGGVEENKGDI